MPRAVESDRRKLVVASVLLVLIPGAAFILVHDPLHARAALIACVCLVLWLTEIVPPFVPTLVLVTATPLLLSSYGTTYAFSSVLVWCVDPILALFVGGFALAAAAQRHGVDAALARQVVSLSKHGQRPMLALVLGGTALLSMWMSNIAAAAMMLTALRPILSATTVDARFRTALLLSVAMGGNLGGMATPIGTGPNALAIAAVADHYVISFVSWMSFAVPLVLGMLTFTYVLLLLLYRIEGTFIHAQVAPKLEQSSSRWVLLVFSLAVIGWMTEPLHGVSAPLIALGVATMLFATGLLAKEDLARLDWSTLGLIAGGIALGKLLGITGMLEYWVRQESLTEYPRLLLLGVLVFAGATLSSLMSNTGTAALLVPLALLLVPTPSSAVIVALGTSFGVAFSISTPPNAMAYGEGGLTARDLFVVGLPIMIVGCVVVTLTGGIVLSVFGLP